MPEKIGSNKRVLKNTVFLYVRMLITVLVSLYTSRVVLQYLGVVDFGILNVVGGVVSMFSFITSTMTNASTRFFSYALGTGDKEDLAATFKTTISIYVLLIVIILVIAETIGLWFVWNKLNIPPERHSAAMLVYQISLMIFCCGLLRIPYNSSIIAHERMSFYAYTSIIEVSLKLAIVFMLMVAPFDKLVFYNFMFFLVSLGITFWYVFFCRKFEECKFGFNRDKEKFKSIFSFAGWNFTSNMGDVAIDQGINVLINIFFGPAINAARGIAFQIKGQVASFCTNFQIAAGPQITKYYAAGDLDNMNRLVLQSSKISFYLMFVVSLPAYVGMETVLQIWLKEVPDYALILTRLVLVNIVVNSLGGTMNIAIQASGKIKKYVFALTTGKIFTFVVALAAFLFFGAAPEFSVYSTILFGFLSLIIQLWFYSHIFDISIKKYFFEIVARGFLVIGLTAFLVLSIYCRFDQIDFVKFLILVGSSFALSIFGGFVVGLNSDEKKYVVNILKKKINRA